MEYKPVMHIGRWAHLIYKPNDRVSFIVIGFRASGDEVISPDDNLQRVEGCDGQCITENKLDAL
ncbi:hypothetical protein [Vibrio ulleungensis]|uniref:Uncharacterized protein n=1 Tax=Vibrio ulleungensis TaxID=2807619 RepID=A0ABS2HDS3_9VIBR|nr:hypothetical protein [Vibrio ulleungensis]MBM7034791.1 hypothetical protein [Vibrio ulleungensis]